MENKSVKIFFKTDVNNPIEIFMNEQLVNELLIRIENSKCVILGGDSKIFFPTENVAYVLVEEIDNVDRSL